MFLGCTKQRVSLHQADLYNEELAQLCNSGIEHVWKGEIEIHYKI